MHEVRVTKTTIKSKFDVATKKGEREARRSNDREK